MTEPLTKQARSGSEKRRRRRAVLVRLDEQEWAALEARAGDLELSFAAYLRERGLGDRGPRAQRRAPVDMVELARATAALNKIGSNLNQVARVLNAGGIGFTSQQCAATLSEVRAAVAAIQASVGRRKKPG